jgi:hypothetical protein
MENLESHGILFFIFQARKVIEFHFRSWKVMEFANKRKNKVFFCAACVYCLYSLLFRSDWFYNHVTVGHVFGELIT